jgi:hypothetical protein
MQWQDLHRHFPSYTDVVGAEERVLRTFIWDGVQNNPHIIAYYIDLRIRAFIRYVLRPYLGVTDSWIRWEWQARGSGHVHCLFWIKSAPSINQDTEESRNAFAEY